MTESFKGKVVIVTGASQGIGRAIAEAFGSRGASVVLAARSLEGLQETARRVGADGGTAMVVETDVTQENSIAALRTQVLDEFGRVDVLVNNAGIAGKTAVLWEQTADEFQQVLRVNVFGVFLCCRALMPDLIAAKGSIVMIGSQTGKAPLPARTPYAASKLALVGLVRTLAHECGPEGVRVNLVSPGAVSGERLDHVVEHQARVRGVTTDELRATVTSSSPLRRFVDPKDVAEATVFLASDAAGATTGEDLNVSAGVINY